jgi:4-hydroxybenzoate polyprenyltransferase
VLDGLVVAGAAFVAAADPLVAIRLGLSMTALQFAIGALNDLVDAPFDRGHKPGKPIPAGLVTPSAARVVVAGSALVGLVLAIPSGPATVGLALVALAIGATYDLVAKGTSWSWLPFAIGIPLLPVYGWLGATNSLARWFVALVPMAAVAGAALAIGNAGVDLERDRDAGMRTVATALGPERAWWSQLACWVVAGGMAVGSLVTIGADGVPLAIVIVGIAAVLIGSAMARDGSPARRERAWELQAIGAAFAGVAWLVAVG